jgi:hypothetical protein
MDGWYKRQKALAPANTAIYTDPVNGEDVLTYDGPARNNPAAQQRRREVNCDGFCVGEYMTRHI